MGDSHPLDSNCRYRSPDVGRNADESHLYHMDCTIAFTEPFQSIIDRSHVINRRDSDWIDNSILNPTFNGSSTNSRLNEPHTVFDRDVSDWSRTQLCSFTMDRIVTTDGTAGEQVMKNGDGTWSGAEPASDDNIVSGDEIMRNNNRVSHRGLGV